MKPYKKIVASLALASFFAACAGSALANESAAQKDEPVAQKDESSAQKDWSITVGLKAWNNEWQTWNYAPIGLGSAQGTAFNPSLTFKYTDWFISAGMMNRTNYSIPDNVTGAINPASREENDISIGYYVHPQVAITLGYKQFTQKFGTGAFVSTYKWRVPCIGISGAAPIQNTQMFSYGNAAIGRSSASSNNVGENLGGGTYTTAELGLGYSFTPSFRLTGGYEFQTLVTSVETFAVVPRINGTDATRGFVLGGSYTF